MLAKTDARSLLVCGTNSFKPKCRTYTTLRETPKSNVNGGVTTNETDVAAAVAVTTTMQPQLIEDDGILRWENETSGTGICPLDPRHNSTAIFTGDFHETIFSFSNRILSIQILFLLHLIDKWFSHQCFLRKRKAARHTHFLPASKEKPHYFYNFDYRKRPLASF